MGLTRFPSDMNTVAAAVTVLLVGTEAFFTGLAALNYRHAARTVREEAEWVTDRLGVEDVDRLLAYRRSKAVVSLVESGVVLVAVLGALWSGAFAAGVEAVRAVVPAGLWSELAALLGAVVALRLLSAPFGAYDTFVVEERFGFNNQGPALWLRDWLLGLALTLAIAGAVGGALLWLVDAAPSLWWIAGWAVVVAVSLAMQVIVPRFVMPLFYDFDPIEEGELRRAVDAVFDRAGFSCEQVYEMNASSRSSHGNAFFAGFGRTKRVVLFDTVVERMELSELQSVLAHELAHWKRGHIWKRLGAGAARMFVVFAALGLLVEWDPIPAAFGAPATPAVELLLAGLIVAPLLRLTAPLPNLLYHRHEREADAFAVEVMGGPQPMVDALCRLVGENLGNPFPHPIYQLFHDSHPPIPERIRYVRELGEDAEPSADAEGAGGAAAD